MKIFNRHTFRLLAALVLSAGFGLIGSGCRRDASLVDRQQLDGNNIVFCAEVGSHHPQTMLTPSDGLSGGLFENDDTVGLFLYDQGLGGSYSYLNTPYLASDESGQVVFSPLSADVYYKTYNLHNIYAYFPYSVRNGDASALGVSVSLDQSSDSAYIGSDFLSSRVADIVAQQISPLAPELKLNFDHRMSSIVVKVVNADGSALVPTPVITIANTGTQTTLDITGSTPLYTFLGQYSPIVMQQLSGYSNINLLGQLCFRAIAVPQGLSIGKALIKVKIGSGAAARLYEYVPQLGDAIVTAGGFVASAEHVFELRIRGTELIVQGGDISAWGEGSRSVTEINGEGKSAARMNFRITGDSPGVGRSVMERVYSARLTIDGKVRSTSRLVYNSLVAPSSLACYYYQDSDWGYDLTRVLLLDIDGRTVLDCVVGGDPLRIVGNPTDVNYSTVIGSIDALTGVLTGI